MTDPDEVLRSTPGKTNFQRIVRLLICGGKMALSEIFDKLCPPSDLPRKLNNPATRKQLAAAKLTKPQWDCLYPSPGVYGKTQDFDISLLFKLLTTICNVSPPAKGWNVLPTDNEHSLAANLVRIKYYRHLVHSHIDKNMDITDEEFSSLRKRIKGSLNRMAGEIIQTIGGWRNTAEKWFSDPLALEDERNVQELRSWYMEQLQDEPNLPTQPVQDGKEVLETSVRGGSECTTHVLETAVREKAQDNRSKSGKVQQSIARLNSSSGDPQRTGGK